MKLLNYAILGNLDHKDLMKLCVCDLTEWNRMFRLCENCRLKQIFDENVFDDDTVIISSVITTEMLYELCHHHFIKDWQASLTYVIQKKILIFLNTIIL